MRFFTTIRRYICTHLRYLPEENPKKPEWRPQNLTLVSYIFQENSYDQIIWKHNFDKSSIFYFWWLLYKNDCGFIVRVMYIYLLIVFLSFLSNSIILVHMGKVMGKNGQTNDPADGPTNEPTDTPTYLKNVQDYVIFWIALINNQIKRKGHKANRQRQLTNVHLWVDR